RNANTNGSAIYLSGSGSTLSVTSTTIARNISINNGGNAAVYVADGASAFKNTTITNNFSGDSEAGLNNVSLDTMSIESSIVAGNHRLGGATPGELDNCDGTITTSDDNLGDSAAGDCSFSDGS